MYSISFDEVKQYVESLPTNESVAGKCRDPFSCVIAEAIKAKYPDCFRASFAGGPEIVYRDAGGTRETYLVETDDLSRLQQLAGRFDSLGYYGNPITKEQVLPLFEEVH